MRVIRMLKLRSILEKCFFLGFVLLVFCGCESHRVVVNDVEEREANEIVVFLYSRGIKANKVPAKTGVGVGADAGPPMWSIAVEEGKMTEAMALLNQSGLPRKKGTDLLKLFAKQGLMSSDKEQEIRYQAGLEQQLANTIRKIDGVIDADVQLSFPSQETTLAPGQQIPQKTTAAVYVKHAGVIDDPNSHLVPKIKRLVSGSVNGLDINDVTVISDRARFSELFTEETVVGAGAPSQDYVNIWSIVMAKDSAARFRFLFFVLILGIVLLIAFLGWLLWKFYPILKANGGFKQLLQPTPLNPNEPKDES